MTSGEYWHSDPIFKKLCDSVAKGNLICLTGAGISRGLKLKNDSEAPDWKELLRNIMHSVKAELTDTERVDLQELLTGDAPGENLIEAASILYARNEKVFLKALSDSVDLKPGETSATHKALLKLEPKGILTYNYDMAHENAFAQAGEAGNWQTVLPSDNDRIVQILKQNLSKPFLLKMHGSVDQKSSMVLTRESYRDLFIKYPFYKSFMQQIFTNNHLLIVGFGMSDPDFEMLLQNVFSTFGSPVQEHIVIKHISTKTSKDTMYRLRYGLHFLYVYDFSDIPKILKDCTKMPGAFLEEILCDCINSNIVTRAKAHQNVRQMSDVGKKCLASILQEVINKNLAVEATADYDRNTENSEYVYTYGVIARTMRNPEHKNFLIKEVVDKSIYSEPIAHALVHLRDILEAEDYPKVEKWLKRFETPCFRDDPQNPDPHNRVYRYCVSISYLMKAKYDIT